MSAAGTWLELSVPSDQEAVEQVSEILSRTCPGGVAIEAPFMLVDDGLGARVDSGRPVILRAYVAATDTRHARAAVEQVRQDLGHLQAFDLRPIGELQTRVVHEADWADAWKQHFPVLRVGRRLVIQPTWRRHRRRPTDVVIRLDPGMAFGTGLHPTTRLCLVGLEAWAEEGLVENARLLDVGCGSGILAICAGLLGARPVVGVDTDPLAVDATRANAALNGLEGVVEARRGTLPLAGDGGGGREFDLVCANLVAGLLVALAPDLRAALRPGGRVLASGIFAERAGEVSEAFVAAGLRVVGRRTETDWVILDAERAD
jgi:ribosomal protein L11 methyltransferase